MDSAKNHVEDRLRGALRRRAATVTPSPAARAQLERRLRREPWRLGALAAGGSAVLIVLGALALPWLAEQDLNRSTSPPTVRPAEGWRLLPPAPLTLRNAPTVVWTGSRMLVWGGWAFVRAPAGSGPSDWKQIQLVDGAAYDPAQARWSSIAPAPVDGSLQVEAAWTGREVLVVGWSRPDGPDALTTATPVALGYDPAGNAWRRLPPMPLPSRDQPSTAWTGQELIVWGGITPTNESFVGYTDGVAYDPARNTWRRLPAAPAAFTRATLQAAAWDGSRLIAVAYQRQACVAAAAYRVAANAWEPIDGCPKLASRSVFALDAVWTGSQVVLVEAVQVGDDRYRRAPAVVYNPATGAWRRPTATPPDLGHGVGVVWTGKDLLFAGSSSSPTKPSPLAAAYDPARDRWRRLPGVPAGFRNVDAVWTGSEALFWGTVNVAGSCEPVGCTANTGMAYRPAR